MKVVKKGSTSKGQSKTEIAQKVSEQRYRAIMMSVGDSVIVTDTEGRVEMMNPVAEELTGWRQEEAQGKSLEAIFHIINEEIHRTVENPVRRIMREGVVKVLANHTVLIAKDGLVLMDIKMPVMDGYTAVRLIRESKPDMPIIAQTAYVDDKTKALQIGCNDFLSKPFDKQKLLSVMKEYI